GIPAMKGIGVKVTDVRYIVPSLSLAQVADSTAAVSNAILRFRSEGIDHVMIQDGPSGVWAGTGLTFLFMNAANSQSYHPAYGFNSYNSPGWSVLPANQQHGMLAVSWDDYQPLSDAGWTKNAQREKCFKLMRSKSITLPDTQSMGSAAGACDIVWFVQRV